VGLPIATTWETKSRAAAESIVVATPHRSTGSALLCLHVPDSLREVNCSPPGIASPGLALKGASLWGVYLCLAA
jgi:hypothetical protein